MIKIKDLHAKASIQKKIRRGAIKMYRLTYFFKDSGQQQQIKFESKEELDTYIYYLSINKEVKGISIELIGG